MRPSCTITVGLLAVLGTTQALAQPSAGSPAPPAAASPPTQTPSSSPTPAGTQTPSDAAPANATPANTTGAAAPVAPANTPAPAAAPAAPAPAPATASHAAALYDWQRRARARLQYLDLKLDNLKEEQSEYSLGGPISLTAIGGGILLFSAFLYLERRDTCDGFNGCDNDDRANTILFTGAVVGAALGTVGLIWLVQRVPPRRKLSKEVDKLEKERDELEDQLMLYPQFGPQGAGLRLVHYF